LGDFFQNSSSHTLQQSLFDGKGFYIYNVKAQLNLKKPNLKSIRPSPQKPGL
jgi:hypothetical protein